jgi:hypothetical protein
MQPATHFNPGVSAYDPPPGTRAEPIAHRGESRDQARELSSATNFAREYSPPELAEDAQLQEIQEVQENQVSIQASTKREVRRTGRKQSRVGYRRRYEQAAHAYAQERDDYWQPRYPASVMRFGGQQMRLKILPVKALSPPCAGRIHHSQGSHAESACGAFY